jgi:hypothetical protein
MGHGAGKWLKLTVRASAITTMVQLYHSKMRVVTANAW